MLAPEIVQNGKTLVNILDPKLKNIVINIKNIVRGSRRAKRAGVLDAVLSSGARSAPELGPASGFRGLNSDHLQIRKFQPLNLDLGYLRKCTSPLTGQGSRLSQPCIGFRHGGSRLDQGWP